MTGSLFGTVKDESGGVLPAASVRVSSPALIGGPSSTLTNEKGQFRLPELAPGVYTLEIEMAAFATYREEELRIAVGGSVERTVMLKLAGVAESVDVEGRSLIEARRSGLSSRYQSKQLGTIPVRRYSMFDFIRAAPGVSATSPSSGTNNSVSVFGSGVNENKFLLGPPRAAHRSPPGTTKSSIRISSDGR
jgi:Carboxypeptidase regulatory-like domain